MTDIKAIQPSKEILFLKECFDLDQDGLLVDVRLVSSESIASNSKDNILERMTLWSKFSEEGSKKVSNISEKRYLSMDEVDALSGLTYRTILNCWRSKGDKKTAMSEYEGWFVAKYYSQNGVFVRAFETSNCHPTRRPGCSLIEKITQHSSYEEAVKVEKLANQQRQSLSVSELEEHMFWKTIRQRGTMLTL
jgi:hypothetical protein